MRGRRGDQLEARRERTWLDEDLWGCGGGECRVKEVEGKKALLIPGFFNRFSTSDEAVRAAEEMAKARAEKVDAEIALEKADDEKGEETSTSVGLRRT